jgi:hypothetical protein
MVAGELISSSEESVARTRTPAGLAAQGDR